MTFAGQLRQDLGVFLNPDEHAEPVNLAGLDISAVVATDSVEALDEWKKRVQDPPGVNVTLLTLHLRAADAPRLYPDDAIAVNGLAWTVLSGSQSAGMLTIHLYRHEA